MLHTIWDAATRGDFMYAALALFAATLAGLALNDARKSRAGTLESTWSDTHPEGKHPESKSPMKGPGLVPPEGPSVDLGDLNQASHDNEDDQSVPKDGKSPDAKARPRDPVSSTHA